MQSQYKERMAQGFVKLEERRLVVNYVIVHPDDYQGFKKEMGLENAESEDKIWGAYIIKAPVHQKGLIQVCSQLFEDLDSLEPKQVFSVVDISDL